MSEKSALAKDYMSSRLVTFKPTTDVLDAVSELIEHRISGAPVVDDFGNLVGLLSEYDCLKILMTAGYHAERGGPVADFMVTDVTTVDARASIIDIAQLFESTRLRRAPVLDDNRLVGQISRRDVLRALRDLS